jgi:hypothetical protein
MKFVMALVPLHLWHIWRDHMLKAFGAALLLVCALAMTADPARALQAEPKPAANLVSKDSAPVAPGPVAASNEADFGSA